MAAKIRGVLRGTTSTVEFRHPSYEPSILIRVPSTDFNVCRQWADSARPEQRADECRLVVDAGANIGASSRMLAARFPAAAIIAIELEASNFEMLHRNTSDEPRIEAFHAGLWSSNDPLVVAAGAEDHKWAFQARAATDDQDTLTVPGLTLDEILEAAGERHGLNRIDVLKLDIEGGERTVLESCESWIDRVDAIMIELHEEIEPGATAAFDAATVDFPRRWEEGELVCRARVDAKIVSPSSNRQA